VLDGDPAPSTQKGAPQFSAHMSILAKRSPISATAEQLLTVLTDFDYSALSIGLRPLLPDIDRIHIKLTEGVQRRATKLMWGMENLHYEKQGNRTLNFARGALPSPLPADKRCGLSSMSQRRTERRTYATFINKSSVVAEMGDRLTTIGMGRKWEGLLCGLGPHWVSI